MVEVVTVDHGLRAESASEARFVETRARGLGLAHATLVWSGAKAKSGIQDAAREARYRLMAAHAASKRITPAAIVTAHTEDDQAETLLMRLARGSGADGLSAMTVRRRLGGYDGIEIVRPLLTLGRDRLLATLSSAGMDWVDDPSNASLDFERVRLRAARPELDALGLTSQNVALSARRLARARAALDASAEDLAHRSADVNDGIFASIERAQLRAAPPEIAIRVLARVLTAFGGEAKAPRLAKVEALADALAGKGKVGATLGGCIITADSRAIRVYREFERQDLPELVLEAGSSAIWDNRFKVGLASARALKARGLRGRIVVRALGARAYATLRPQLAASSHIPVRAAASLPSFWADGALIAVPQLRFKARWEVSRGGHGLCKAVFVGWEFHTPKSGSAAR
jgi:tRNA(Ile)-lysidine synthase